MTKTQQLPIRKAELSKTPSVEYSSSQADMLMEFFDQINLYLMSHPALLAQLEFLLRIKFWILLALALYFITLPHRHSQKQRAKDADKDDNFLA